MNRSKVFLDSSILVGWMLNDENALSLIKTMLFENCSFVVNHTVISEVLHKVPYTIALNEGVKGIYDFKKKIGNYSNYYQTVTQKIESLLRNDILEIVNVNWEIIKLASELGVKYNLLINDAIIVATCKYYGINKIATFDCDFKKIDFLEIIN